MMVSVYKACESKESVFHLGFLMWWFLLNGLLKRFILSTFVFFVFLALLKNKFVIYFAQTLLSSRLNR